MTEAIDWAVSLFNECGDVRNVTDPYLDACGLYAMHEETPETQRFIYAGISTSTARRFHKHWHLWIKHRYQFPLKTVRLSWCVVPTEFETARKYENQFWRLRDELGLEYLKDLRRRE